MAEGDVEFGYVVDLTLGEPSGTELVADAAIGATTLTVDYAGDFEDVGEVFLNGTTLAYTSIAYGTTETDPDVIALAAPLAAAAVVDDKVVRVSGGEPLSDWLLHVSLGDGHPVDIPIPYEQRTLWSDVDPSAPVPVMVSADLERLVEVPGRTPAIDGTYIVAGTLPPPDLTDLLPPTAATTVTPIGGIGSMFYRWTEITNNDPVTYRLHVRDGSAPTTDGTYEVAAGVGLTSASVRKLKDGTAIVGDGTVTYHAIVTVEDADGLGPASADVTGIPAQVNTADIAVNAVTADHIQFNTLSGETITGLTVQTAAAGKRTKFDIDDFTFYSGDPAETVPATFILQKVGSEFRFELAGTEAGGVQPFLQLVTDPVAHTSRILFSANAFDFAGPLGAGDIGAGTFRDSIDARIATQSTDGAEVTTLINSVGPTLTMTSGDVGTGAFRTSVDARANAMSAARMQAGTASSGTVVAATTKTVTVTFPTAFSSAPKVTLTSLNSDPGVDRRVAVVPGSETTTTFQVAFWRATGTASFDTNWLAVKP